MKEIGRFNVENEALDEVFDKEHKGTSVKDCVGGKLEVVGFVVYDNEGSYHLKFFAKSGKKVVEDFYTGSQVFIKDFMFQTRPEIHSDRTNLNFYTGTLLAIRHVYWNFNKQMQALVTVRFWILNIVFHFQHT